MRFESDLLLTKITIPSAYVKNVRRERLMALLELGMQRKLTTVVAPAGYGKTTLLREWVNGRRDARRQIAWLSLDAYDSNPARFWLYLTAALKQANNAFDYEMGGMPQGEELRQQHAELDALLNAVSRLGSPICLVLDDFHEVCDASVHASLSYFIKRAPENLHVVVSSRTAVPIPLSRLRAQQQLLELTARDLAFTQPEAETFLSDVMDLRVNAGEADSLLSATEGWAVGLQFAALSMRESGLGAGALAKPFADDNVLEYFTEEVIDRLSPQTKDFLMRTSVLGRFSAELCDAVLERADSQRVLEEIEGARLFVERIGEDRGWYRYHALFADALQAILKRENPGSIERIHRGACAWLWENGYDESAVPHALEIEDHALAAEILEGCGMEAVTNLHLMELSYWIDQLPDALIQKRPSLGICYALACFDLGYFDAIEPKLACVEEGIGQRRAASAFGRSDESAQAEVAAIRAAVACVREDCATGIALAQNAIDGFPHGNAIVTGVNQDLAYAYESAWDLEAAVSAFEQVCQSSLRLGCHRQFVRVRCEIARIQKKQGRLEEARSSYESALQHALQEGLGREWITCAQTGLAEICIERDDPDMARPWVSDAAESLTRADASSVSWLHAIPVYCRVINCQLALGEIDDAAKLSTRFRNLLTRLSRLSVQPLGEAIDAQVRVWLAAGDIARARHVLHPTDQHAYGPGTLKTAGRMAIARVQVAEGDYSGALVTLGRLEEGARKARAIQLIIELLCLEAVSLRSLGVRDGSLRVLEEALELGRTHGYLRIFPSQGEAMRAPLEDLRAAQRQGRASAAARKYLKAVLGTFSPTTDPSPASPDTAAATGHERRFQRACEALARRHALSPRQGEVLLMLARGRNTRYIEESLRVSNHTAKSHVYSVYRKLGVHSQQELISRVEQECTHPS